LLILPRPPASLYHDPIVVPISKKTAPADGLDVAQSTPFDAALYQPSRKLHVPSGIGACRRPSQLKTWKLPSAR
jgi:hypothetical protein